MIDTILALLDSPVAFNPTFSDVAAYLGDSNKKINRDPLGGLLLSQLFYLSRTIADDGGWFWQSHSQLWAKTGISTRQVGKYTKRWEEVGLLDKTLRVASGVNYPVYHYRMNWDNLVAIIQTVTSEEYRRENVPNHVEEGTDWRDNKNKKHNRSANKTNGKSSLHSGSPTVDEPTSQFARTHETLSNTEPDRFAHYGRTHSLTVGEQKEETTEEININTLSSSSLLLNNVIKEHSESSEKGKGEGEETKREISSLKDKIQGLESKLDGMVEELQKSLQKTLEDSMSAFKGVVGQSIQKKDKTALKKQEGKSKQDYNPLGQFKSEKEKEEFKKWIDTYAKMRARDNKLHSPDNFVAARMDYLRYEDCHDSRSIQFLEKFRLGVKAHEADISLSTIQFRIQKEEEKKKERESLIKVQEEKQAKPKAEVLVTQLEEPKPEVAVEPLVKPMTSEEMYEQYQRNVAEKKRQEKLSRPIEEIKKELSTLFELVVTFFKVSPERGHEQLKAFKAHCERDGLANFFPEYESKLREMQLL